MPAITIRGVPQDVLDRLRERAKRHHRSLQGELRAILEETVRDRGLTIQEVEERLAALDFETGEDAVALVREGRDAR